MSEDKMPYKVMFIKDNAITYESDWFMAASCEVAKRLVIAQNHDRYDEEVRVLVRPFC